MLSLRAPIRRAAQRGIGLVELMVGITVGMIVVAGASVLVTTQLAEHRRLMLEVQVQQDLRATGELIARELRRAGATRFSMNSVWAPGSAAPIANAYSPVDTTQTGEFTYSYARDDDAVVDPNTELFGFRLRDGGIYLRIGTGWQPLTDVNTLIVDTFSIHTEVHQLDLVDYCTVPCPPSPGFVCPPQQEQRRFDIVLSGHATHDSKVRRRVDISTRLRNDHIVGRCATPP